MIMCVLYLQYLHQLQIFCSLITSNSHVSIKQFYSLSHSHLCPVIMCHKIGINFNNHNIFVSKKQFRLIVSVSWAKWGLFSTWHITFRRMFDHISDYVISVNCLIINLFWYCLLFLDHWPSIWPFLSVVIRASWVIHLQLGCLNKCLLFWND